MSDSQKGKGEPSGWRSLCRAKAGLVFRDGGALRTGQIWNEKINVAIDDARYFVVLCSDPAANSVFVREEVERALGL